MIEVIVGVWLTSLLISIPITALNVRYAYRLASSEKYLLLNQNLAKIAQYWSLSTENFKNISEGSPEEDAQKVRRTYLYMGVLGLLSVLGLLFLMILSLSLQVLVKNRLTRQVFSSDLAQSPNLSTEEVRRLVDDLRSNRF